MLRVMLRIARSAVLLIGAAAVFAIATQSPQGLLSTATAEAAVPTSELRSIHMALGIATAASAKCGYRPICPATGALTRDQYVGWAPQPPDEYAVETEDNPQFWSFVGAGDLIAPNIATVLLPFGRRAEFFHRTQLVNRPIMMGGQGRRFAVNPGIAPANIAAIRGRPLPTYRVRPHVLAGTGAVPGAIQVRDADLRRERTTASRTGARLATRDVIQPTSNAIRPARTAQQPLARGEAGRLDAMPPRATRGATLERSTPRLPGMPSAQRRDEQRQTRSAQPTPNASLRTTAQAPVPLRPGAVERRARVSSQGPNVVERHRNEGTPEARAQAVPRGPAVTARTPLNRTPAVAARPHAAPPPRTAAAPPPHISAPRATLAAPQAAPPVARPAPPAAAARPGPVTTGAAPRGGGDRKHP
jgi:hypothetical protein